MAIIVNDYGNCTTDTIGSGERTCDLASFGDATGFGLPIKSWKKNLANDTFTEADYRNDLQGFEIFPFLGIYDFAENTPENEKNTSTLGVMTEIRNGKPQLSFSFAKGSCFHKALYDKRGQGRWDFIIFFETGVLVAESQDGTEISGFNAGMLSVETFKLLHGTDPQMSTAMVQLLDSNQYNARHRFITWESLGWNANEIGGVVETAITYGVTPATGTTVKVKVTSACNSGDIILGLDDAALWALGGTQTSSTTISAVSYSAVTNLYTLTVTPTMIGADSVQPKLVGTGGYSVAEDADGNLFKGQAALAEL